MIFSASTASRCMIPHGRLHPLTVQVVRVSVAISFCFGGVMVAPILVAAGAALTAAVLGKKSKTRQVRFKAKKPVKVPVKVGFKTSGGKKVKFNAHKTVKKKVPVSFRAKRK
jgi:hypothetical protein